MVAIPSSEPVRFATTMATTAPNLHSACIGNPSLGQILRGCSRHPALILQSRQVTEIGSWGRGIGPVVFDFLDEAEAGVSTEADLIPWTPSDQPGVLVSGNDSPSPTNQRKFRDNRVLFSQVTPAMVGNGSR